MRLLLAAALLAAPAAAEHRHDGEAETVVSAAKGAFVFTAQHAHAGAGVQLIVRRLSPDGGEYWRDAYGRNQGEEAAALGIAADGGVVLAGARRRGCFAVRWDAQGRVRWEATTDASAQCRPAAVVSDAAGSSYMLATVADGRGGFEPVVVAFDARGDQRWRFRYPAPDTAYARDLILDPRGDRVHGFVLRRVGSEFVEEFYSLDHDGRRLDR
ncbi:MAG: hypothetical protein SF051_08655 [Elusimicrobiota bacterium]|nr:hypothetical protein [Elusimicrobiota bacterium]